MDQLTIYLLVCVHTSKALINHLGGMGAHGEGWRASVGVEDALQSSLRDTERSSEAEGLTEGWSEGRWEWLNTQSTEQEKAWRGWDRARGDWTPKRDCSKEDLDWGRRRENNWAVDSVMMQPLSSEPRRRNVRGRERDWLPWLLANKNCLEMCPAPRFCRCSWE